MEIMPFENYERAWDVSPMKYIHGASTPTLFVNGRWDFTSSVNQADSMFVALKKLGVDTQIALYRKTVTAFTTSRNTRRITTNGRSSGSTSMWSSFFDQRAFDPLRRSLWRIGFGRHRSRPAGSHNTQDPREQSVPPSRDPRRPSPRPLPVPHSTLAVTKRSFS